MSQKSEKIILTNMCMVYDSKGQVLVMLRTKSDWPGLTFPGGHVEDGELLDQAVIREMKEETGLTIEEPELAGVYSWTSFGPHQRDLTLLYRTNKFSGELNSSSEGKVFWLKPEEIASYPWSNDFATLAEILTKGTGLKLV